MFLKYILFYSMRESEKSEFFFLVNVSSLDFYYSCIIYALCAGGKNYIYRCVRVSVYFMKYISASAYSSSRVNKFRFDPQREREREREKKCNIPYVMRSEKCIYTVCFILRTDRVFGYAGSRENKKTCINVHNLCT